MCFELYYGVYSSFDKSRRLSLVMPSMKEGRNALGYFALTRNLNPHVPAPTNTNNKDSNRNDSSNSKTSTNKLGFSYPHTIKSVLASAPSKLL